MVYILWDVTSMNQLLIKVFTGGFCRINLTANYKLNFVGYHVKKSLVNISFFIT